MGNAHGMRRDCPVHRIPQDPPSEFELPVSLEHIHSGCTRTLQLARWVLNCDFIPKLNPPSHSSKIFDSDGSQSVVTRDLEVSIKPGTASGTRVVYHREGDQYPGRIPSDAVIVVRDKPHPTFKRNGSDVRLVVRIALHEALCGFSKTLPTVDGLGLPYQSTKVVKPGQVEV